MEIALYNVTPLVMGPGKAVGITMQVYARTKREARARARLLLDQTLGEGIEMNIRYGAAGLPGEDFRLEVEPVYVTEGCHCERVDGADELTDEEIEQLSPAVASQKRRGRVARHHEPVPPTGRT